MNDIQSFFQSAFNRSSPVNRPVIKPIQAETPVKPVVKAKDMVYPDMEYHSIVKHNPPLKIKGRYNGDDGIKEYIYEYIIEMNGIKIGGEYIPADEIENYVNNLMEAQ